MQWLPRWIARRDIEHLALGVGIIVGCELLSAGLESYSHIEDLTMLHVLAIVFLSVRLPRLWATLMALGCVISYDYFFIPPRSAFAWDEVRDFLSLGAMLVVAVVVSTLGQKLRQQERLANHAAERQREQTVEVESERIRSSILSSISHDLRTPLASIIAAGTTLLRSRSQLSPNELDVLLRAIVGESERLARIVQNLLSITRLESPTVALKLTPEAIDDVLSAALERMGSRLVAGRVHLHLEKDLPLVNVEPALLEQVFVNLLENALRYAPESPIDIDVEARPREMSVRVADRGPGIPQDLRERVFEKFQRGANTRQDDGGMGLGLTICKAIVLAHSGSIEVKPRDGGGTVVEVTLPLSTVHLEASNVLRTAS